MIKKSPSPTIRLKSVFFLTIVWSIFNVLDSPLVAQEAAIQEENHRKAAQFIKKDSDSARYYIGKMETSQNHCRRLFAMLYEANLLYEEERDEACDSVLKEIIRIIDENPQPKGFATSPLLKGQTYSECTDIIRLNVYRRSFYLASSTNEHERAYESLMKMKEVLEGLPLKDDYYFKNKISLGFNLAGLKGKIGRYDESNEELFDLLREINTAITTGHHSHKDHLIKQKANINVQIGRNYIKMDEENPVLLDSAEIYFEKAYRITQSMDPSNTEYLRYYYLRKGEIDLFRKNYTNVLRHMDSILSLYNEGDNKRAVHFLKSESFFGLGMHDSAIFYGKKILYRQTSGRIYDLLAESYFAIGELDSAYKYSKKRLEMLEEIQNNTMNTYRKLSKDDMQQIMVLNRKIEEEVMAKSKGLNYIVLISLLSIVSLIAYFMRTRKLANQRIVKLKGEFDSFVITERKATPDYEINEDLTKELLSKLTLFEKSDVFLNNDFTLHTLAKLLGTNTTYLSRIINEEKGSSFNHYLAGLRMDRLMELLESNPLMRRYSVQALAETVGYKNASSFSRAFKKYKGISPSEFLREKFS